MKRLLASAAILIGTTLAANAASYGFSFDNVEGSVPGTVSGFIELPDGDGTFAATSVVIMVAPAALGYAPGYEVLANLSTVTMNTFTVFHGAIDGAVSWFSAWESSGSGETSIYREFSLNDMSTIGTQLVFAGPGTAGGGGATLDQQNATVSFGGVSADVPLPAAAPLLLIGLGGLAALGRKRRA